jgi:hypothetical protein
MGAMIVIFRAQRQTAASRKPIIGVFHSAPDAALEPDAYPFRDSTAWIWIARVRCAHDIAVAAMSSVLCVIGGAPNNPA